MITMLYRLLKSCNVGNKCRLSTLLWSLAAWILFLHIYNTLFPSGTLLPEPRNPWSKGMDIYADLEVYQRVHKSDRTADVGTKHPPRKKGRFPITIPFKNKGGDRIEEAREQAALQKLAVLFPGRKYAIDPSKTSSGNVGYFYPGRQWRDTDGKTIQAHGGGILYVEGTQTFYWYGENKDGPTYHAGKHGLARVDVLGISCYSSKDLWAWKFEGMALRGERVDKSSDLYFRNVVERPKVIYNARTKNYIMWMHIDNGNYSKAAVGVAISTQPEGPFEYMGSKRPHGCDSRDMTIFKDDNGDAYIIYSSLTNSELHIGMLTEDYTDIVERGMKKALVSQHREAPAVFKHRNIYYMVTSGCTGWNPNGALVHVAESMLGPWATLGDPCIGGEDEEFRSHTFFSQGSFVLPLPGLTDSFLFMADRWRPANLADSRYVWLVLTMGASAVPIDDAEFSFKFPQCKQVQIPWAEKWKLPEDWKGSA
ncbi:uncharacterized protein [Physcomitrium patens]|uniref:Uncharacterized protein n=1 Tax=Physcomitrium patens TaxID=3218 RepID=A0A2K1IGN9_PHYPA|nr:uncharacterized protein LOC112276942 [Physcomitrium patens]XP_024364538.1 uncharacterized protein LOC112276942 [Physcomitrium patens]XP_024364539.1 uncharacterized protein LOC112276942 [Physcomitrium patens]XP_024364540.1 uncharacterized protein LOC112276942 [Physcomitrium patens]PNR28442.1 hypothetical protein PHYPA_029034 [Physcomitrium patens]|eukprot:XP_024364537.1 uncharacterized protein LOC112276942 [Physcomitrella patens]